jgi:hypothetical protein
MDSGVRKKPVHDYDSRFLLLHFNFCQFRKKPLNRRSVVDKQLILQWPISGKMIFYAFINL